MKIEILSADVPTDRQMVLKRNGTNGENLSISIQDVPEEETP